jgi:phospholipid-translocating ATPase
MAVSQFIPQLRIGYLYTYWGPLGFVISVTMIREAIDDFRRYQRDREVNSSRYCKLTGRGRVSVASSDLKVGDIVYVEKGLRVPADMILLRTTEHSGTWKKTH